MVKRHPARDDPLWYKDAIIYELHVKAFRQQQRRHRRFPGADPEARLPAGPGRHLSLAAAVLPFAAAGRRLRHRRLHERPSALRHDGRFQDVPRCGPRARPAGDHRTGDQPHLRPASLVPGARGRRPPARPSATTTSGATPTRSTTDARIIFTDTEKSNWTWDPVAKAYYWHRFFSHQPDLNFDNPRGHRRDR